MREHNAFKRRNGLIDPGQMIPGQFVIDKDGGTVDGLHWNLQCSMFIQAFAIDLPFVQITSTILPFSKRSL